MFWFSGDIMGQYRAWWLKKQNLSESWYVCCPNFLTGEWWIPYHLFCKAVLRIKKLTKELRTVPSKVKSSINIIYSLDYTNSTSTFYLSLLLISKNSIFCFFLKNPIITSQMYYFFGFINYHPFIAVTLFPQVFSPLLLWSLSFMFEASLKFLLMLG